MNRLVMVILIIGSFKQTWAQTKDTTITFYFNKNEYTLTSLQKEQLTTVSNRLLSIQKITGFADTTGSLTYNKQLSRKRALSIAGLLNNQTDKTSIDFKGEEFDQDPDMSKNRKVELLATIKTLPVTTNPVQVKSLSIENIYFVPDRAIITDESLPYVKELADLLLKNYKTESFEILGHVNYETDKDSSQLPDLYYLSERRARTIYSLLKEYGIPAERMHYKGVGNSQPVIQHPKTDEEKRKNMRVEVIISK